MKKNRQSQSTKNAPRKPGKSECTHQRIVGYHADSNGTRTGQLVCRECGAVIPDPLKTLRKEQAGPPGSGPAQDSVTSNPGCAHQRVVSYVYDGKGKPTGLLACRECRAVFPDPLRDLK